jgi:hypothetical protein
MTGTSHGFHEPAAIASHHSSYAAPTRLNEL